MWNKKRHSDDMCIKCKNDSFELPPEPSEEEESSINDSDSETEIDGNIHITPKIF